MASSTPNLDLIAQSQSSKEVTANALFDAGSPATLFGRRASLCSGLNWFYYGGVMLVDGVLTTISNNAAALALTASATNYIEATRAGVYQAPTLTLITGPGAHPQLPSVVVFDASPLAHQALAVASALARFADGHLLVLILADPEQSAAVVHAAAAALHAQPLETRYRMLTLHSVSRLAHMLRLEGGGTLVLPGSDELLQHPALQVLLEETESPVLLVR